MVPNAVNRKKRGRTTTDTIPIQWAENFSSYYMA